ncbi:hypothetical protein F2Q69_00006731 [Brassica cretica]|uniref:Uncharacterized protein n=1 Tax=Brassica cretica TaxID=69181 RepID=A0A8S9PRD4_BRACR|nr:hypothetical protein F2Q69_00006731 [Brassica cretica]
MLPDGDLYKEITKYQCKIMDDVLSRACAQVKWDEDLVYRSKLFQKQEPKGTRNDKSDIDDKSYQKLGKEA